MELELKLALRGKADAAAVGKHPVVNHYLEQARPAEWVVNWYFDTPTLSLWRQGIELRLRRCRSGYRQTLKRLPLAAADRRSPGGLHRLEEWEVAVRGPTLDVAATVAVLPEDAAGLIDLLLKASATGELGPRVRTRYRRATWMLRSVQGDLVEMALDVGEVRVGDRALSLCEVELELKTGAERSLFELAAALQRDLPLRPELRGKAERGFGLLAAGPESPRLAKAVALDRSMSPGRALRTLAEECLMHVQANEAGVLGTSSPEYVHQMRVGLRRLRAALALFAAHARPPRALLDELKWSASVLGRARDAEVLACETLARAPAAAALDGRSWSRLCAAAQIAAENARREAVAAVQSPRHVAWQLELMAWLCGIQDRVADPGRSRTCSGPDLEGFAKARLRRLGKRLLRLGDDLPRADATALHRARIAVKKLRYAIELLAPLISGAHHPRRLRALGALQERLGRINDASAAMAGLARLSAQDAALAPIVACTQSWLVDEAARQGRGLGRLWRRTRRDL